jgi:hypothetical protein
VIRRRAAILIALIAILLFVRGPAARGPLAPAPLHAQQNLTDEERGWLAQAGRYESEGWIHVSITGAPFARGFQYGYLTAAEYAEAIRVYRSMTYETLGMDYSFFVDEAVKFQKQRVTPELLQEMEGIAADFTKAGVPTTVDEVIGWNAWIEMTGYWWPTVATPYARFGPQGYRRNHCSSFIATGSATKDGRIVIGHNTFTEFWNGQFMNVIPDITPDQGQRIVMQTSPGWVASMTDFWVTGAGLVIVESTLVGYQGYDTTKVPEWVRARNASQYAQSIDQWVELMNTDNNGGYANMWLIGDIKTNEIARFQQVLYYQNFDKKRDGWFLGDNTSTDPRIRNLESSDTGYTDIRQQTGARRVRWPQLLNQYNGRIDATIGQTMLGDEFDVYLGFINPSSRTISAHYDADPMYYVSDPNAVWNIPFFPGGSIDAKVTTADAARSMSMWGRFGRGDGAPFDADDFLRQHPQWDWQKGYLQSRPSRPWVYFEGASGR